jgi:Coenzyme PQQ synthesis protein D (PqqD)
MQAETRFRLNAPNVIAETIEGEAILVDLRTGNYYSIQGSGSQIWGALVQGVAAGRVAEEVAKAFSIERAEAEAAVSSLSEELEREGLIVPLDDGEGQEPSPSLQLSSNGQVFSAPVVEKYTDMQDLVLLDPVHEVDERGWPHVQS